LHPTELFSQSREQSNRNGTDNAVDQCIQRVGTCPTKNVGEVVQLEGINDLNPSRVNQVGNSNFH
ncbi:hypothetical protein L0M83_21830, partial [Bacteroides uniformis]